MAEAGSALITLDNLKKVFYTDEVETHALAGIHLEIKKGEYVAIAGPSGCGKSTLLSILGLLDTPSDGKYWLNGRPVEQLTELVGRVPLKDLVRETTDVIERLCIEAALELTGDNRASAAEILGLSRQSLYVKLRRYGLGDLESGEE